MRRARVETLMDMGSRNALAAVMCELPMSVRVSLEGVFDSPAAFGTILTRHFDERQRALDKAEDGVAGWRQTAIGVERNLAELKQRNRLLAALLLHSFDANDLSWEAGAIEAALDGVKDKELLLRRDPASGTLYLRAALRGDPEPWERL